MQISRLSVEFTCAIVSSSLRSPAAQEESQSTGKMHLFYFNSVT